MQEAIQFYKEEINHLSAKLKDVKSQLLRTRMLRLLAFLSIGFTIYYGFKKSNFYFIGSLLSIAVFIFLLLKHTDLKKLKKLTETKLK